MKKNLIYFFFLAVFAACKKENPTPVVPIAPNGKVQISVSNEVDGQGLEMGKMKYTNAAGNSFSVNLLKYYISNIVFTKADGSEIALNNYNLIDASDSLTANIQADSLPNGNYSSVKFFVGVDKPRNHNGAQTGDLDPSKGMIWTWNTGYIFFKHEGQFVDSSGATKPLLFHFGTDAALVPIELPLGSKGLDVKGDQRKLNLRLNINSLYTSPNNVNFNDDNNRQSVGVKDFLWLSTMQQNFGDAFAVKIIQ